MSGETASTLSVFVPVPQRPCSLCTGTSFHLAGLDAVVARGAHVRASWRCTECCEYVVIVHPTGPVPEVSQNAADFIDSSKAGGS